MKICLSFFRVGKKKRDEDNDLVFLDFFLCRTIMRKHWSQLTMRKKQGKDENYPDFNWLPYINDLSLSKLI